jgi:uncharacterized protein (DUF58 family)
MKTVTAIPPAEYAARRDPWLDVLLDGKLRELSPEDWQDRYKTARSAASAIHQAGRKRGHPVTVAIRGDNLYVQAKAPSANGKRPRKAAAAKTTGRTRKTAA